MIKIWDFFSYKFLEAIESFLCSGIIRFVFCKQYSSLWMENRLDDRTRLEWRDHKVMVVVLIKAMEIEESRWLQDIYRK